VQVLNVIKSLKIWGFQFSSKIQSIVAVLRKMVVQLRSRQLY